MSISTTVTISIHGPDATAITFTPAASFFTVPVASGTLLGQLTITPSTWVGNIALTGTDAASVTIDSSLNIRTAQQITAVHDLVFTVTATP